MSKRQQTHQTSDNSRRPLMALQCTEKLQQPKCASVCRLAHKIIMYFLQLNVVPILLCVTLFRFENVAFFIFQIIIYP